MLAGLALVACGGDADPVDGAGDTDGTEEPATGAGTTGDDPSGGSTSGNGTTGADPSDSDGSTGEPDDGTGGSTGGDEPPVMSDLDLDSYRVTWTSRESQVKRMFTAAGDFSGRVSLTPSGPDSVDLDASLTRPRLHSDGKTIAFVRGTSLLTADILTGESQALTYDGVAVRRFEWAPEARELAWIDDSYRFRRSMFDGTDTDWIRDLDGDGQDAGLIQFQWSPLGDRLWGRSQPGDAAHPLLWAVDADGTNYDVVAQSLGATAISNPRWAPAGDEITFIGDLDGGTAGLEMYVGERDGVEMISHANGGAFKSWASSDHSRLLLLTDDGMWSVAADGTDLTLINGGAPANISAVQARVTDDGAFAATVEDGELTALSTTLHTPLQIEASDVDGRSFEFEPGGVRLAYAKDQTEIGGQRTLWMVDGEGVHLVNHDLPEGSNVSGFRWYQGGLMYVVMDADNRPTLHHTELGETPLFIPTQTEWSIRTYPSPDENLLIVRLADIDFETGRLCAFDVTDITNRIALGCEDVNINGSISVFVTQPE